MKYRVVFRERGGPHRTAAHNPVSFLEGDQSNSVVRKSTFVLRRDPQYQNANDPLEDDTDFRHLGTEVWDYEVADGKDQEFKDALLNSGSFVEFAPVDPRERE